MWYSALSVYMTDGDTKKASNKTLECFLMFASFWEHIFSGDGEKNLPVIQRPCVYCCNLRWSKTRLVTLGPSIVISNEQWIMHTND